MNVYTMLQSFYHHAHPGSKHSWVRLNQVLHDALSLAIQAQMVFTLDEIQRIYNNMKGEHWFGVDDGWILRKACIVGNASAARSYLKWKGRRRFTVPKDKQAKLDLLYENREFTWKGERVTVTSFDDEAGTVTVCSYTGGGRFVRDSKVKRRYTLTATELRDAFKQATGASPGMKDTPFEENESLEGDDMEHDDVE